MLKAGLDLIFRPKVVVAKKSMYKEINTSFIKTKEQHSVQLKLKQAYIRVNCVSKRKVQKIKITSIGPNQGLAWSSDSSLWGNQVQKIKITSVGQNQCLAWSSDSSLWGNQVQKIKITSVRQYQGLAWSSDSSL